VADVPGGLSLIPPLENGLPSYVHVRTEKIPRILPKYLEDGQCPQVSNLKCNILSSELFTINDDGLYSTYLGPGCFFRFLDRIHTL
jgi:hypothetical protein